MITITLQGRMVSGKNAILVTRSGLHIPKPKFKAWRSDMVRQVWAQKPAPGVMFSGPVSCAIDYWPGDRIRRDCTGIMDALWHLAGPKHGALVADDSQFKHVVWTENEVDRGNPRVVWKMEEI